MRHTWNTRLGVLTGAAAVLLAAPNPSAGQTGDTATFTKDVAPILQRPVRAVTGPTRSPRCRS